ncbi:MAG: DUF2207 domain-containing protein [Kosmotogaceae bacterium]
MSKSMRIFLSIFILVFVFAGALVVFLVVSNPYLNESDQYTIQSALIEQEMDVDGMFRVHEIIDYEMIGNFRGLYRYVPEGRYVEISDIEIWTEGREAQYIEFLDKDSDSFEARIWLVPYNSSNQLSPSEAKNITLHVKYKAKNVLEVGKDTSQVLRKFWGEGWDSVARNITGRFIFPNTVNIEEVYMHPDGKLSESGNDFEIFIDKLPPNTFAEARFILSGTTNVANAVQNNDLSLAEVNKIENRYATTLVFKKTLPYVLLAVVVALLIVIYLRYGREPKVSYNAEYEREIPYNDSPDVVNSIVRHFSRGLDDDGISATLMSLYKKDYIDIKGDKKKPVLKIDQEKNPDKLSATEKALLKVLETGATKGKFDFKKLQKLVKKDRKLAIKFNKNMNSYKNEVTKQAKSKNYTIYKGNVYAKLVAALAILLGGVILPIWISSPPTRMLLQNALIMIPVAWIFGAVIFMFPKVVFARRTKEGTIYHKKWMALREFLKNYSLISERPPESVTLWEDYLIYGTALGIADQVEKALQKLVPENVWLEDSRHSNMYRASSFIGAVSIGSIASTAASTAYSSSSSGSGSFGSGGVGGGSGGGGGGAF